jgi:hypothetical protein
VHAVKLDALPRRDPQRVVAVARREVVERDPLGRRHHAARDAAADHHLEFLGGFAEVAVVLLVDAVKLDELLVILGKAVGRRVGDRGGNVAREGGDGRGRRPRHRP